MKNLEDKIREAIPRLNGLTKGCIFTDCHGVIKYEVVGFSKDGKLTATYFNKFKISWNYNIDKFRVKYKIIGHPIKLNDVLEWHSKEGRDKYSHFEVSKGEAYFSIYDGEETDSIIWDLSSVFLADQSDELKKFLNNLHN